VCADVTTLTFRIGLTSVRFSFHRRLSPRGRTMALTSWRQRSVIIIVLGRHSRWPATTVIRPRLHDEPVLFVWRDALCLSAWSQGASALLRLLVELVMPRPTVCLSAWNQLCAQEASAFLRLLVGLVVLRPALCLSAWNQLCALGASALLFDLVVPRPTVCLSACGISCATTASALLRLLVQLVMSRPALYVESAVRLQPRLSCVAWLSSCAEACFACLRGISCGTRASALLRLIVVLLRNSCVKPCFAPVCVESAVRPGSLGSLASFG
jgi:hypothetical protein